MTTQPPVPDPVEETEDEKRMRQMMASMRGGIIPSLNDDADDKEACVLSDETLDRRDHGVEMLANLAKMRAAQSSPDAFRALLEGKQAEVNLDELVSKFGTGEVKTDAEYCVHCAQTIWYDQEDRVWRHTDGEQPACRQGGGVFAEPVRNDDEVDTDDVNTDPFAQLFAKMKLQPPTTP